MKRIIILSLAIISSFCSFAQTNIPQLVSFSAVVRDANNQPLANTPVSIRLSFKQGGSSGTIVYCALHQDSTNSNGFISIQLNRDVLGTGCNGAPSTAFENIPWQNGGFWMEVEYQTIPSSPFVSLGQLELASSFYAFSAGTAERLTSFNTNGIQNGDVMTYNSTTQMFQPSQSGITSVVWGDVQNKPTIDTSSTNELQTISISNDTIYLSNGGFVKLPASSTGAMLAPTVTNQAASNLQSFSATLNGIVNANGLITSVIFRWGLTTTYDDFTFATDITGTENVPVSANLSGLLPNTTYHYCIRANNAVNISNSNDLSFTTSFSAPLLTTTDISSVSAVSASIGGDVTNDGGSPVTTRGVCYSTNPSPSIANSIMPSGTGSGTFVSSLTGLTPSTTYYARAYATNALGTSYGNELIINTLDGIITLTTFDLTDITSSTATSGGEIFTDGGSLVTNRGVCWSTSQNPTILDTKTQNGTGLGPFNSSIVGLSQNTTYSVRAYATNGVGTGYGNEVSFTTSNNFSLPTLSTTSATSITSVSAIVGGNITSDGGSTITTRGICWSTSNNPTIGDSVIRTGNGIGAFSISMTNLSTTTTYYVRAFATNNIGTSYGTEISFITQSGLPTLTTTSYSDVKGNSAKAGVSIIDNGGSLITAQGLCWSTSVNPTTTNSIVTSLDDSIMMSGLSPNTTYYVRAYATNGVGTGYGNQISFNSGYVMGSNNGGGLVFYNDGAGHGLVCANADQSSGAEWGCYGTAIGGASTAINTGAANTNAIVAGCATAGIAAKLCYDLVLNTYSDWYLPSRDELNLMYVNLKTQSLGSYAIGYYWSSSEYSGAMADQAEAQNFNNGNPNYGSKNNPYYVRAVRAF